MIERRDNIDSGTERKEIGEHEEVRTGRNKCRVKNEKDRLGLKFEFIAAQ